MMRRLRISMLTLLTACLGTYSAITAQAQEQPKFNFHIGGGIGTPLNPTAEFAGVSGAFQIGAGPNLSDHSSLVGEFMWHGLPPNSNALARLTNPLAAVAITQNLSASSNLYAVTANYKYHREGKMYGLYLLGGGGWYYRKSQLTNFHVVPGTVCEPVWNWWGYSCQGGYVEDNVLVSKGVVSGGINGGAGVTIKLHSSGVKWYMEARYHYAPQGDRTIQVLPLTFGLQW